MSVCPLGDVSPAPLHSGLELDEAPQQPLDVSRTLSHSHQHFDASPAEAGGLDPLPPEVTAAVDLPSGLSYVQAREIISENQVLKARLRSSLDELHTDRLLSNCGLAAAEEAVHSISRRTPSSPAASRRGDKAAEFEADCAVQSPRPGQPRAKTPSDVPMGASVRSASRSATPTLGTPRPLSALPNRSTETWHPRPQSTKKSGQALPMLSRSKVPVRVPDGETAPPLARRPQQQRGLTSLEALAAESPERAVGGQKPRTVEKPRANRARAPAAIPGQNTFNAAPRPGVLSRVASSGPHRGPSVRGVSAVSVKEPATSRGSSAAHIARMVRAPSGDLFPAPSSRGASAAGRMAYRASHLAEGQEVGDGQSAESVDFEDCTPAAVLLEARPEVRALRAEVLSSAARIASLEAAVHKLQHGADPAAVEAARSAHEDCIDRLGDLEDEIDAANDTIATLEAVVAARQPHGAPVVVSRGMNTMAVVTLGVDAASLLESSCSTPVVPSLSGSEPFGRGPTAAPAEYAAALEKTLAATRAELAAATLATNEARAAAALGMQAVDLDRGGVSVAVQADMARPFVDTLRAGGVNVDDVAVAEALVEARMNAAERDRATAAEVTVAVAAAGASREALLEMERTLVDARDELVAAHRRIEELAYALDLERRDRYNPERVLLEYRAGKAVDAREAADLAAVADRTEREAEAQVAFLNDVVAASKEEAATLRQVLSAAAADRDAAVQQLQVMRVRGEKLLVGCREVTEQARGEAADALAQLRSATQQRDVDAARLHSELSAALREQARVVKQRDAARQEAEKSRREADEFKMEIAQMQEAANRRGVPLRRARQQPSVATARPAWGTPIDRSANADMSRSAVSQYSGVSVPYRSVHSSPGRPMRAALEERGRSRADARRQPGRVGMELSPTGRPVPSPARSEATSSGVLRPPTPPVQRPGVSKEAHDRLRAKHAELDSCMTALAALVPAAHGPKEVVRSVATALTERFDKVDALDKALRQRTTALQASRKDLALTRERSAELERKVLQQAGLKARRHLQPQRVAEAAAEAEQRVGDLHAQLASSRAELQAVRMELAEGREVMLDLIGVPEEAMVPLVSASHSLSGGQGDALASALSAGPGPSDAESPAELVAPTTETPLLTEEPQGGAAPAGAEEATAPSGSV